METADRRDDGFLPPRPLAQRPFRPAADQQELARKYVIDSSREKKANDQAGVLVFGSDAAIESRPNAQIDLAKIQAVVGTNAPTSPAPSASARRRSPKPARNASC